MFSPFSVPPDASLAQRLGAVVLRVLGALGERTRRVPDGSPVHHLVPQAVYDRVHAWLRARRLAIMALMERIQAGTLRPPRPYAPRMLADGAEVKPRRVPPPAERIPPVFGWVCRWAPEARFAGHDLSALLEDAEMKALVLAAPERMVRLWTPMLNALGRPKPDWFPKLPRRLRRSRAGRPHPDAHPPRPDAPRTMLTPPPPYVPPSPCLPPPKPVAEAAPWAGLGPGPCATLAQYRSPFQPGGDDHPPALPAALGWPTRAPPRIRRN
jgi:hypothetical protein